MPKTILDKLQEINEQKNYSGPAKSVMEHLRPILSKSSTLRQRWMWELLQNASDLGDGIKARFELTDDRMIFSHNGKPFSLGEAYNLIKPDSTKDDDTTRKKSVIGQFGTGFISTHILSKIIQVKGISEDDGELFRFDFRLDRSERDDKEYLIESIKKSETKYGDLELIDESPKEEFQTSFTYFINDTYSSLDGKEIVDFGVESFNKLIPYVLSFRPQLTEIEVFDTRNSETSWTYQREEVESDISDLTIQKTVCCKNGKHLEDQLTGTISNGETKIAFPIEALRGQKYRLLPFPEDCPKALLRLPNDRHERI